MRAGRFVCFSFVQRLVDGVICFRRFLQSDDIGFDLFDRARQIIGIDALHVGEKTTTSSRFRFLDIGAADDAILLI